MTRGESSEERRGETPFNQENEVSVYRSCAAFMPWRLHIVHCSARAAASQMWLLGRMLPYEIGRYITKKEKHWQKLLSVVEGLLQFAYAKNTMFTVSCVR